MGQRIRGKGVSAALSDGAVLAAVVTALVTLLIAVGSGSWAVWVKIQENRRAKWRRVEDLMQVIHNGASKGLWAQKLAVAELLSIAGNEKDVILIMSEASTFFQSIGGTDIGRFIDRKLNRT